MARPKRAETDARSAPASTKKAKGGLAVGDQLPEFTLETDEGNQLSSAQLVREGGIVLFSYPRANTPGCTAQAQGLSAAAAELAAAGYRVIGISADKPAAQGRWREKYSLAFNLLCDPGFQVLPCLGLTKTATSVLRSHLVIAKGGAVLDVQYGVSPKNSIALAREFCLAHPAEPLAPPGTAAGAADAPAGEAAPEPQAEATEGSS